MRLLVKRIEAAGFRVCRFSFFTICWWILFYSHWFCRKHCHILDDVIS
nr:MAG TPA: hypothetical protein [Caudoviricetes sp.]